MSKYTSVEGVISRWASAYDLKLYTSYKDSEVRSVEIRGKNNRRFQIWIDPPGEEVVEVHLWDFKKKRKDWKCSVGELRAVLEIALDTVYEWDDGSTSRT